MSLKNLVAGDYGQDIELTFVDVDATGTAVDISSYATTMQMVFVQPDGTEAAKTAAFKTDGTDGVIVYTVEADFLTAGIWSVRGRVASDSARLTTVTHLFEVIS